MAQYLERLMQVLRNQLNGKNEVQQINPADIMVKVAEETEATGIKTKKAPYDALGFHSKSSHR